jgi:hypothetical protein
MAGLRAESARNLVKAEESWARAKAALDIAERERTKWRARCRPLLADGLNVVGGIEITVTPTSTGKSFRLAEYLKAHPISKAMRPFVGEGSTYDRWTVKRQEKST